MKTNRKFLWMAILGLVIACVSVSCRQEADNIIHTTSLKTTTYKIAVVLPLSQSEEYKKRIDNTVGWALENIQNAQKRLAVAGDTCGINLDIEWYDEDKEKLLELATKLTLPQRDSVMLIIGPEKNDNVSIMAHACKNAKKPLIVPSASSESVIRSYAVEKSGDKAEKPFLWSLCETDVTMSNLLVSTAWEGDAKTIGLLSPDDTYGKTFYEWVPYMAVNMGVQLMTSNNIKYTKDNLAEKAQEIMQSDVDYIICAAETPDEVKTILEARQKAKNVSAHLLFTNAALSATLTSLDNLPKEGLEGIAPYANPSTGFQAAYKERFGYAPAGFEAQIYDAILLSGIAAYMKRHTTENISTNEIIRQVTSMGDTPCTAWNEMGLSELLQQLKNGEHAKISGASGLLRFDSEAYTTLVEGTYVHWLIYDKKFTPIDFRTNKGGGHTTSAMASWNWEAANMRELSEDCAPVEYKPLKDKWAILVQGSSGWDDYRHQADVLNVYQMLKRNGWPDDHIVLIISDDIANNKNNKLPGEVRTRLDTPDLYKTAKIDYSTDTLTVADVKDIILGKQSSHLPTVLNTTDQTDILFFWSGHGIAETSTKPNCFYWRNDRTFFSETDFRETLQKMFDEKRYRRILFLLEPCHSRNMAQQTDHMPGMLAFASANGNESSFADFHSNEMGTWMSDRFSNNLVNTLTDNPGQTYKELYEYLYRHTMGSHVYVENDFWFGNLFTESPKEFFIYNP